MNNALIYLEPDSHLNLQSQIRQKLVEAILQGAFPRDRRLPSSRKLAEQLGVARNTVVLVYQQLVDEGYLVSRERSGIYVNEGILEGRVGFEGGGDSPESAAEWRRRFKHRPVEFAGFPDAHDYRQYPYPFIDGQFDAALFPVAEWREAARLALGVREIRAWSLLGDDADDPQLIAEIRAKILPRRGIQARPEEILVTLGAEQALYLIVQLLVAEGVVLAAEEPGNPLLRQLVAQRGGVLQSQPVDQNGLVVDARLDRCDLVYVTPSHQVPTAVTMPTERRQALLAKAAAQDLLIIEDDADGESNYLGQPHPALRCIDHENRVIYIGCMARVLGPGIPIGYMVAPVPVIAEARRLRRLMVRHPPYNNQRAAAFFLSLGYYDTVLMRLHQIFRERWAALRDALNHYLPQLIVTMPNEGGTAFWVRGPGELSIALLAQEAAKRGILIEPVQDYYAEGGGAANVFRLGVTAIPCEKIRAGVASLAALIYDLTAGRGERLGTAAGERLRGAALERTLIGATLLCKTVYGAPYSMQIHADGSLTGCAGYAGEDRDCGRWWIEDDRWYRRWQQWSYGEVAGFHVVREGDRIKWFNAEQRMVDAALLQRPADSP